MSGPLLWPSHSESGMTIPVSLRSFSRCSRWLARQTEAACFSSVRGSRRCVRARAREAETAKLTAKGHLPDGYPPDGYPRGGHFITWAGRRKAADRRSCMAGRPRLHSAQRTDKTAARMEEDTCSAS